MRFIRLAVACLVLSAAAGPVQAGLITSEADPALAGASLETFNSASSGTYSTLTLSDVTVSSGNTFFIEIGGNSQFAPPNPSGDRVIVEFTDLLTFEFHSAVSAFGIVIGAANRPQTLTAFDGNGDFLESLVIPDQVSSLPHPFAGFFGISSNTANIARFTVTNANDGLVYDDLYYTANVSMNSLPEPSSFALFGVGACVAGLAAARRRRERKQTAA